MPVWTPSSLFVAAEANLRDDHREGLRVLLTAIEAVSPSDLNAAGPDLRRNIEREEQLSSNPHGAEPMLLQAFLQELQTAPCDHKDPPSLKRAYEVSANRHAFKGMPVRSPSTGLLRYIFVDGFFSRLANKLLDRSSAFGFRLQQLIDQASSNRTGWQRVLSFVQRPEVWSAIPHEEIRLAQANSMFVTFEGHGGSTVFNRSSTSAVWNALALWWPKPSALLEISLELPIDPRVLRFPTVADAGWYSWFQCAPIDAQHGWTNPRDPSLPPQPEIIMSTVFLSEIADPARLRILDP